MTALAATAEGFFDRRHGAALGFLVSGAVWFVVGTTYGAFTSINLVAPEVFTHYLVFGRARPAHVNTVIYGFIVNTLIGAGLYYVPSLLRNRLWSERLGWLSLLLTNLTVLSGPISFALGHSQGREYAEYIWSADILYTLAVLGLVLNLVMTVLRRNEDHLYVSVWYFVALFIWVAPSYVIGNVMWHPDTGALTGILDSIILWFYGHNLPGLLLTPLAVGAAYYVIPRVSRTPLYSYTLSLIGFWTLVIFYTHIGGHHLLQAPVPNWVKMVSVVDSMAMVIPVFTVLINLYLTGRGRMLRVWRDVGGRFVLFGLIWYLITCIQGPAQSLTGVQRVTHFNNWTIGHAHIAVLGFSGFIALGALWHVLPLAAGRQLFSSMLARVQFGLLMLGLSGFFAVLTAAGLIQGESWDNGEAEYRILQMLTPYMVSRAALGVLIILAAVVGLANVILTMTHGEPILEEPEETL